MAMSSNKQQTAFPPSTGSKTSLRSGELKKPSLDSSKEVKKQIRIVEPKKPSTNPETDEPSIETLKERRMTTRLAPITYDIKTQEEAEPDFIKALETLRAASADHGHDILVVGSTSAVVSVKKPVPKVDELFKDGSRLRSKIWVPKIINPMVNELTIQHIKDLREAYDLLEDPVAGMMRENDIVALIRACGTDPSVDDVTALIKMIKPVYPGYLTFEEFKEVFKYLLQKEDSPEDTKRAFKQMDLSKSGKITFNELKNISILVGYTVTDDEIKEMIDATLPERKKDVSLARFAKLVRRKLCQEG